MKPSPTPPALAAVPDSSFQNGRAFSTAQCDALFAAVLAHDDIHLDAELPAVIHLDYSQQQLAQCYRICRQLWDDGVDRAAFASMVGKILHDHAAASADRVAFKHVRAKFKHLRFAYVVCDARHQCPKFFDWMTVVMGCLQDAIKTRRTTAAGRWAMLLRLTSSKFPFLSMQRQMNHFQPATTASFAANVRRQIDGIRINLAKDGLTGREFHNTRIIISRQVAGGAVR